MSESLKEILKRLTSEQRRVFITLSVCFITMMCPETLIAPFFPSEAGRHGVSSSLIGIVIGGSAVVGFVSSPFIGAIIAVTGPKKVMITGMVLNGAFSVIFGCLEYIQSTYWFAAGCFICTGFVSLGNAIIYTGTLTYAAKIFPNNFNLVAGMTEMYIGIAEVIALLPGALLHEFGGFKLPFIVFGFLHLLIIPVNLFLLPPDEEMMRGSVPGSSTKNLTAKVVNQDVNLNSFKLYSVKSPNSVIEAVPSVVATSNRMPMPQKSDQMTHPALLKNGKEIPEPLRLWHLLTIPRTMIMAYIFMVTSICWAFINFTLEPHLSPLTLTKTQTNLFFFCTSVMYGISSPILGWIADHLDKTWYMATTGLVLTGLTFGFLGPLPFLGLQNSLWLNIVCLTVITLTLNTAGIPAIEATLVYTIEAGHKDNVGTYAIVSSLISTVNFLGLAIGSFTGGFLYENIGYPLSASLYGALCFLSGATIFAYFMAYSNKSVRRNKSSHLGSTRNSLQLQTTSVDGHNNDDSQKNGPAHRVQLSEC